MAAVWPVVRLEVWSTFAHTRKYINSGSADSLNLSSLKVKSRSYKDALNVYASHHAAALYLANGF